MWFAEIDGRAFEQQRSSKRSEVKMVQCEKWSSSRISIGLSDVLVNDLTEGVNNCLRLFASNAKLLRKMESKEDCDYLKKDLDKIHR